jgi:hypothetical protein
VLEGGRRRSPLQHAALEQFFTHASDPSWLGCLVVNNRQEACLAHISVLASAPCGLSYQDGTWVTPAGASFRVIVVHDCADLSRLKGLTFDRLDVLPREASHEADEIHAALAAITRPEGERS